MDNEWKWFRGEGEINIFIFIPGPNLPLATWFWTLLLLSIPVKNLWSWSSYQKSTWAPVEKFLMDRELDSALISTGPENPRGRWTLIEELVLELKKNINRETTAYLINPQFFSPSLKKWSFHFFLYCTLDAEAKRKACWSQNKGSNPPPLHLCMLPSAWSTLSIFLPDSSLLEVRSHTSLCIFTIISRNLIFLWFSRVVYLYLLYNEKPSTMYYISG